MSKWILPILAVLALSACVSSKHRSSILVERGVKEYERDYFATKESFGIENRLKRIFVQGYIEEGMNQEMVNLLWGPPDRETEDGRMWEYYDAKTGDLITRLKWAPAETKRLGVTELVLVQVEGDRYGGSPPPEEQSMGSY
jgi:hypothetical protein